MKNNSSIKDKLIQLNNDFKTTLSSDYTSISEEKIRSGFLNKLFELFGWNLSDITEVVEEKHIKGIAKDNLDSINSSHKKPDYIFCEGGISRLIFDAKISLRIFNFQRLMPFKFEHIPGL